MHSRRWALLFYSGFGNAFFSSDGFINGFWRYFLHPSAVLLVGGCQKRKGELNFNSNSLINDSLFVLQSIIICSIHTFCIQNLSLIAQVSLKFDNFIGKDLLFSSANSYSSESRLFYNSTINALFKKKLR